MKLKTFKIIIAVIFLFLIFLVLNKFFYGPFKNTVFLISETTQKFLWQKQNIFSQTLNAFFESKTLRENYEELKKENFFLKGELLRLKDLEKENKELREVLELGLKEEFNLIFAEVISEKNKEDSILVNRGEKDGVSEGMTAITKEKVLVGKVKKVFDDFSQIVLISEKDFTFSVEVQTGEGSILGACKGEGDSKLKIELLPQEVLIKEGDIVFTSLLGGTFPKNLLVGKIKSINKEDVDPFQKGEITPFFKELTPETLFLVAPK